MRATRRQKRIDAVEEAVIDLLDYTGHLNDGEPSRWDRRCRRIELLKRSRRYSRAIDNLSRDS